MEKNILHVGLDVGSTTVKIIVMNSKLETIYEDYQRHFSDTKNTVCNVLENLIKKLRKEIPDVIIRTTVMVGFPGETAEDYEELYKFVEKTKFDKMGAFSYSKEENTPAEKLKEQIHPATKKSRYNKIMQLQQKVVEQNIIKHIGKELEVLIENNTFDEKYYIGRSYMQAPEIDEVIYIKNTKQLEIGQFIKCKIIDTKGYDLIGEIVNN